MSRHQIVPLPELKLSAYRGSAPDLPATGQEVGTLFGRLLGSMQQLGVAPDRPTLAWYAADGAGPVEVGVGLPVTELPDDAAAVAATGLEPVTLPAAERAVVVRHRGSLAGLQDSWVGLHTALSAEGLTPLGPCREVYLSGDLNGDDWVIDLQQPVA